MSTHGYFYRSETLMTTAIDSPFIKTVTTATFEADVMLASQQGFVLLDFWADWCEPCKVLKPVLEKLAVEYNGAFTLALVNTEEEQMLAQQIGVRSLPTVLLLKDGAPVDQFMGALSESEVRAFLDKHLGDVAPASAANVLADADAHFDDGAYHEAIKTYQAHLEQNPDDVDALLGLADSYLQVGESEATLNIINDLPEANQDDDRAQSIKAKLDFAKLVADAPALAELEASVAKDGSDLVAREYLGIRQLLLGQDEAALDSFLALMQRTVHTDNDIGKQRLTDALKTVQDKTLVAQYRRKMTSLLF